MRLYWLLLATYLTEAQCQEDFPWLPDSVKRSLNDYFIRFRKMTQPYVGRTASQPHHIEAARKKGKIQMELGSGVRFPCDTEGFRSASVPTSVHRLMPGDIDVIAAMGDSLTAGFGVAAKSLVEILAENRGLSWSIGGQGTWRQFLTLPNVLKEFNPSLLGYSLGDALTVQWGSQLNVAEGGAMARDMPYMARQLVDRIRNDSRIDVPNHWKLVTLMVGGNDYCSDMCYHNLDKYLARRRQNLIKTLDILLEGLPRTLVNFAVSPNVVESLPEVGPSAFTCWYMQRIDCPCVRGPSFQDMHDKYAAKVKLSQLMEIEIASMPKYQKNDFAVVSQPFTLKLEFPKSSPTSNYSDLDYLSYDCFHLSQKGNARAANALWNNMLQRVGSKSTNWGREFDKFLCPTKKSPYIYTNLNSQQRLTTK